MPKDAEVKKGEILNALVKNSDGEDFMLPFHVVRASYNSDDLIIGGEFEEAEEHYSELVHLVYGDSQRWLDFWNRGTKPPSLLRVLIDFLRLGLKGAKQTTKGMAHYFLIKLLKPFKLLRYGSRRRSHEI